MSFMSNLWEKRERLVGARIEALEARIAPATLINSSTVTYLDIGGDLVTIKLSKGLLTTETVANNVLKFDGGTVTSLLNNSSQQELQLLDLTGLGTQANGVSITITTEGTSLVNVGAINAFGFGLGAVTIEGDLGKIQAGSPNFATGLSSLTVESLGAAGTDSQITVSDVNLVSQIVGKVGSLKVNTDVNGASLIAYNGAANFRGVVTAVGNIGAITIGNDLIGRANPEAASNSTGLLQAEGNIGSVYIGGDVMGGGGSTSGSIISLGSLSSLTIVGVLQGGAGSSSGSVFVGSGGAGNLSSATIGAVAGSSGSQSGFLGVFNGKLITAKILGDVSGGSGAKSGSIYGENEIGSVSVDGDLVGNGVGSAVISSGGKIGTIKLGGSIEGGAGLGSGSISSGSNLGKVTIGDDIKGGSGIGSGNVVVAGKLTTLTVGGKLWGGTGDNSGSVFTGYNPTLSGDLGSVSVGVGLIGGDGMSSGTISSGGKIGAATIGSAANLIDVVANGAALQGGDGLNSGALFAFKSLGALKVVGEIIGGDGDGSGTVTNHGKLTSVKVNGNVSGGSGAQSGSILSLDLVNLSGATAGDCGAVTVTGSWSAGSGEGSGRLEVAGTLASLSCGSFDGQLVTGSGVVHSGNTGKITINGSMTDALVEVGGKLTKMVVSGAISQTTLRMGNNLGSLSAASLDAVTLIARGQAIQGSSTDLAIGSIIVLGNVSETQILAGYNFLEDAVNPDAQIGTVNVGGNWGASDLVAGVKDVDGDGFGDSDDALIGGDVHPNIVASIASVIIAGTVSGTTGLTDSFGFVAQKFKAFKIGTPGVSLDLTLSANELDTFNHDVFERTMV